jgi:hypothetical protein
MTSRPLVVTAPTTIATHPAGSLQGNHHQTDLQREQGQPQ